MQHTIEAYLVRFLSLFINRQSGQFYVHPATKRLTLNLIFDVPLTREQKRDYGVKKQEHYLALQAAQSAALASHQFGPFCHDLEAAAERGALIMAVVKRYAPAYQHIRFETWLDKALKQKCKTTPTRT